MTKNRLSVLLALVLLCPGRGPDASPSSPMDMPSVDEINQLYDAQDYVKALDGLITILEANPDDHEARLYVHKIAKQLEQKEVDLMLTSPVDRQAMVREAWMHLKKTPPSAIQDAWSRFSTYTRQNHLLFAGDALLWITQNAPDGSWDARQANQLLRKWPKKLAKKAEALSVGARTPYTEGWRAHRSSHWQTAAALWREVLSDYPADNELQEMIHRDEAELAEETQRQDLQRYMANAEESMRLKHYADAVANLRSALKLDPTNAALTRRLEEAQSDLKIQNSLDEATTEIVQHRYPQAVKTLTDILQIDPKNSPALALLADLEQKLTLSQTATLLQQVAPRPSPKPVIHPHHKAAPVLLRPLEPVPTEPAVQAVKISDVVQSNAYYNRGLMLYASDRFENAIDEFQRAIELDPHNDKAQKALSRVRAELRGGKR